MAESRASEEELAEELRLAVGRFVRATRARADVLQRTHADALAELERSGSRTIAQLALQRGVRHQGMSRTILELERNGLVARTANPDDARGWIISLTAEGRAVLHADRAARRDLLAEQIRDQLTEDERRLLEAVPALLQRLTIRPAAPTLMSGGPGRARTTTSATALGPLSGTRDEN